MCGQELARRVRLLGARDVRLLADGRLAAALLLRHVERGDSVPRDQLQPGDIVFFDGLGHVGIYIGGGEFVHAPHTGTVVQVSSLDSGSYAGGSTAPGASVTQAGRRMCQVARRVGTCLHFFLHMRTTWNGSISFGLVNIPVGLAPATASSARQSDVQFKMLHRECLTPIKQKRWCPLHEVELSPDEIVRGWEVAKGQFVPVEDAELEALESYDTSRSIEIRSFVPAGEVDPIYFDRTYYLVPAATEAQRRPYALLIEAMRAAEVVGLGSFVLAGKEKLCLIRAEGECARAGDAVPGGGREGARRRSTSRWLRPVCVRRSSPSRSRSSRGSRATFEPSELKSEYRAPAP